MRKIFAVGDRFGFAPACAFALVLALGLTAPVSAQEGEPTREPAQAVAGEPAEEPEGQDATGADADVAPTAELDASRLVMGTDTFRIMIQGSELGSQVTRLERVEDGFRFTETTTTQQAEQTTDVRFGPDLAMRTVEQKGVAGGVEMNVTMRYGDGRVTGSARIPGPQGMQDRQIDMEVPANAVDDNVLMALLPSMPLAPNARFSVPVIGATSRDAQPVTLTVTGEESVTVPAGTFDVYAVEMSGATQPLTLYVTSSEPHRLVRMAMEGVPVELVLVGSDR